MAGVSVDYLIRLEQGRDTRPSADVLAALAGALRLSDDELDRLRTLAAVSHGTALCPRSRPAARSVRPTVLALLDQLEPAPAFVINHLTDLLAWTTGYERLAAPLGILDGDAPNLVSFTFTDERARTAYPDWDDIADEQVANLYAELRGPGSDVDRFAAWLADGGGADFSERWARRPVARRRVGVNRIAHPEVGVLRVAFETLQLPDADGQWLVMYLAADGATAAGLDRLAGRHPGALRSVSTG